MKPPIAGPATPPAPTMLICRPSALPRSSSENAERIMAMPVPCVMPAPTPWKIFAPMSIQTLKDIPASTDPIMNTTKPDR